MQIFKSKKEKVLDLLVKLGAKNHPHVKYGSLYDHLMRVSDKLASWGLDENVQLSGLLHSVYNTEYFKGNLLNHNSEKMILDIVGTEVNDIVKHFSQMSRDTLRKLDVNNVQYKEGNYEYKKYYKDEKVIISESIALALSHIMLANDLDHLYYFSFGRQISNYKKYASVHKFMCNAARIELYKIISENDLSEMGVFKTATEILFTGHSGINIRNESMSIAIDPWLYATEFDKSAIDGLDPTQKTVDYMIPDPKNSPADISPDIVLLSHFHTHHSPSREIVEFAKIKPIKVYCPTLDESKLATIRQKMGDFIYNRISFVFHDEDFEAKEMGAVIKGYLHNSERALPHFIYYVQLGDKSVLHIVDAKSDRENIQSLGFNEHWKRMDDLHIDYLFVGGVGHNLREVIDNRRVIVEAVSLTPTQAAKLADRWNVAHAGLIGMYNHSIWDDRVEMGLSVGEAESQFYFALTWLAPAIKVLYPRPGDIYR